MDRKQFSQLQVGQTINVNHGTYLNMPNSKTYLCATATVENINGLEITVSITRITSQGSKSRVKNGDVLRLGPGEIH